ncbi:MULTISPECIES: sigma-E factor negative regulatory protein [Halomonas]|uniref:Sigma factor AlgU negative regulatory protein n=1 Tax=Halomonas halophila TaxID=29573 RepID=A0ABQ0U1R2_9GAMM|nr:MULTISPECIES: sigma-E factor negative regulatory protein [Halomonas]MDR5889461.1 sigma-E factor negative regulatory protein [Halomonas salina]WJY06145.1 sigma-E factor negative regulatory protein [Halomonas halophila]GEK72350.1 sigma factor AlgU negative regulatory protein [Halomonas halophila]
MSQNARESLSALMDNEGDELELRRVLKSLDDEPDAADAWRRYHLMRSLMQRENEADTSVDLSAGVMAALEDEPAPIAEPSKAARRSLPLGRSAGIAAAVSLMVITGVQFYNGASPLGGGEAPVATNAGVSGAGATAAATRASSGLEALGGGNATFGQGASLVDMPMFPGGSAGEQGLMTVGAGAPMVLSPAQRQSLRMDRQQALLLQSYLDRHAEGAAATGGDSWMPLLRASGSESLGQR